MVSKLISLEHTDFNLGLAINNIKNANSIMFWYTIIKKNLKLYHVSINYITMSKNLLNSIIIIRA